jgi:hypothetical protein
VSQPWVSRVINDLNPDLDKDQDSADGNELRVGAVRAEPNEQSWSCEVDRTITGTPFKVNTVGWQR